jgi:probable addiction module antidote protein
MSVSRKAKNKARPPQDEITTRRLRDDPKFTVEYLNAALDQKDGQRAMLTALRHVAEARGGIAKVAKTAGLDHEALYRSLSVRGNPHIPMLVAVMKALGLKLTLKAAR